MKIVYRLLYLIVVVLLSYLALSPNFVKAQYNTTYLDNCGVENRNPYDFSLSTCTIKGKVLYSGSYIVCEHPVGYTCCYDSFSCIPKDQLPPDKPIEPVVNPRCTTTSGCNLCDDPFAYCSAESPTPRCTQVAGQCGVPGSDPPGEKVEVSCGSAFNPLTQKCVASCGNEDYLSVGTSTVKCCGWPDDLETDRCSNKPPEEREITCGQSTGDPQLLCRCDDLSTTVKPYAYVVPGGYVDYCCGYIHNGSCTAEKDPPNPLDSTCGSIVPNLQAPFCQIGSLRYDIFKDEAIACRAPNPTQPCCLTAAQCEQKTGQVPPTSTTYTCGQISDTDIMGNKTENPTVCRIGSAFAQMNLGQATSCGDLIKNSACCFTESQCKNLIKENPSSIRCGTIVSKSGDSALCQIGNSTMNIGIGTYPVACGASVVGATCCQTQTQCAVLGTIIPPTTDSDSGGGVGGGNPTGPGADAEAPADSADSATGNGGFNIFAGPNADTFAALNPLRIAGSPFVDQFSSPAGVLNRVLLFIFPLSGLLLFLMLVWGGFEMVQNASNQKGLQAGRQRITAALIGFGLLFGSFWIIQIVEYIFGLAIL